VKLLLFFVRRLVLLVITLWLVSALTFAIVNVLPGDAAVAILGDQATPENVAALRLQLGLNEPVGLRYVRWVLGLLHGDLGDSLQYQLPIAGLLTERLHNSIILAGATMLIAMPISAAAGVISAVKRDGWLDRLVTGVSAITLSLPDYIVGLFLILFFSIFLQALPGISLIGPSDDPLARPDALILPVATLTIGALAQLSQIARTSMIEVLESDYIRTAILKGLDYRVVVIKHALRNALVPTVSLVGMNFGYTLGGLVIVETMFAYSGIGLLMTNAVTQRDVPVIEAAVLVVSIGYGVGNMLADVTAFALNPRLRT
jgi:peptide/nickel transport system permease protein